LVVKTVKAMMAMWEVVAMTQLTDQGEVMPARTAAEAARTPVQD
jgi:hypothetical protein